MTPDRLAVLDLVSLRERCVRHLDPEGEAAPADRCSSYTDFSTALAGHDPAVGGKGGQGRGNGNGGAFGRAVGGIGGENNPGG